MRGIIKGKREKKVSNNISKLIYSLFEFDDLKLIYFNPVIIIAV